MRNHHAGMRTSPAMEVSAPNEYPDHSVPSASDKVAGLRVSRSARKSPSPAACSTLAALAGFGDVAPLRFPMLDVILGNSMSTTLCFPPSFQYSVVNCWFLFSDRQLQLPVGISRIWRCFLRGYIVFYAHATRIQEGN